MTGFEQLEAETWLPGLKAAAAETWLIWCGLFTLGLGFGMLVVVHGLPVWLAPLISAAMFAGSVEFVLIGMLAAGAPIAAMALTTLLINSRHVFYGLSFPLQQVRSKPLKAYSVFALCDEAYALLSTKEPGSLSTQRIICTQAGLHLSWVAGAFGGAVLGSVGLRDLDGLQFILTALFVVLTIDVYRAAPVPAVLTLAIGSAVLAQVVLPGSMILAAMSAFVAVSLLRRSLRDGVVRG